MFKGVIEFLLIMEINDKNIGHFLIIIIIKSLYVIGEYLMFK